MNCTHCGTPLPPGALFCGECGRSVGSASSRVANQSIGTRTSPVGSSSDTRVLAPARWVEDPVTGEPLVDEVDDVDVEVGAGESRCEQCGSAMAGDDIFCPECGFVSRSITRAFTTSDFVGETRRLDLASIARIVESPEPVPVESPPEPPTALQPQPGPEPEQTHEPEPELVAAPEPEHHETASPLRLVAPERLAPPTRVAPPTPAVPRARPAGSFLADDEDDIEATRIVSRLSGNRFVLQFSTGESFTVHGTGLIGRNPQPEPGEFFDHLVRVLDSGKSVSKTHLEFGQEQGAFWVKDRFSGNGTVIREPDISARRAEADRRYRVVRGTRIDIGEQFFVIS